MDIRQTATYATFMQKIGWRVEYIDGVYIFIKPFPLIGATIKIQRTNKLPNIHKLRQLMRKYHASSISFEPDLGYLSSNIDLPTGRQGNFLKNPFLPTKNILIDLKSSEETIFKHFTEAKRRAVRRAQKNNLEIKIGNIETFIKLKGDVAGILGFLTITTLKPLYETFTPKNAEVLLAFAKKQQPLAGIFLLFNQKTAYYWMAAATKKGKKSFAPTLLVWEAIKRAKQKKCTVFDFEGIYDERYPKLNQNWLGFTKFKSGFGRKETYYPKPFQIT